jgi:hypothetical protein
MADFVFILRADTTQAAIDWMVNELREQFPQHRFALDAGDFHDIENNILAIGDHSVDAHGQVHSRPLVCSEVDEVKRTFAELVNRLRSLEIGQRPTVEIFSHSDYATTKRYH